MSIVDAKMAEDFKAQDIAEAAHEAKVKAAMEALAKALNELDSLGTNPHFAGELTVVFDDRSEVVSPNLDLDDNSWSVC